MPAMARVDGAVECRWRRRRELICARAVYGVRRREEDLLPARETRSKSSAAERCGCGGACVKRARCGVAADRRQLKFSQRSIWRHSQRETPSRAEKSAE